MQINNALTEPRRGEIYLVDLSSHVGSEQTGIRPALIIQNNIGNTHSPTTIVIPLTSARHSKPDIGTHVLLKPADCGILQDSVALCEQIRVIDKSRIKKLLGSITNRKLIEDINRKLLLSIGII